MAYSYHNFNILNSVDSTNNYAMAKVHAGMAKHGDAWFAKTQTAAKGQRGKTWLTGNDENIALSIVLQPLLLDLKEQFKLSVAVALSCRNFLEKYSATPVKIKWPNDIYCCDRKAGGILIENVIGVSPEKEKTGNPLWKYAVAGIGFNINQTLFPEDLNKAVSLKQVTGKHYDNIALAMELQQTVLEGFDELNQDSFDGILSRYNQHLYKCNEHVILKKDGTPIETIIQSVTASGLLQTKVGDTTQYFSFGEVEWVL